MLSVDKLDFNFATQRLKYDILAPSEVSLSSELLFLSHFQDRSSNSCNSQVKSLVTPIRSHQLSTVTFTSPPDSAILAVHLQSFPTLY
jgi:hypothetical protein